MANKSRAASTAFKRSKKPADGELRASWCRPSRSLRRCPRNTCRKVGKPGAVHRGDIGGSKMQILIVGIGALGGTIAARAIRTGLPVRLAARNTDSAEALRRSGLRVCRRFGGGNAVIRQT